MKPCVDKFGVEIMSGDYVVYGHALGRCAGLRVGKVIQVSVGPAMNAAYGSKANGWRLRVQGVDEGFGGRMALAGRGTLYYPDDRVVRLAECPAKYVKLLSGVSL